MAGSPPRGPLSDNSGGLVKICRRAGRKWRGAEAGGGRGTAQGGEGKRRGGPFRRHSEMKRRPFANLALQPQAPAVAFDDLFANGQPDACARIFTAAVEPLEELEDALEI